MVRARPGSAGSPSPNKHLKQKVQFDDEIEMTGKSNLMRRATMKVNRGKTD